MQQISAFKIYHIKLNSKGPAGHKQFNNQNSMKALEQLYKPTKLNTSSVQQIHIQIQNQTC